MLLPLVALATPLYNRIEPRLFGVPFFYWFQLAMLAVGVVVTAMVAAASDRPSEHDDTREPDFSDFADLSDFGDFGEATGGPGFPGGRAAGGRAAGGFPPEDEGPWRR